jgi:FdhD protein
MIPDFLRTFPVARHEFDGTSSEVPVPVEEPLELQLRYPGDPPSTLVVLMRTPGDDLDFVMGFLLSERIIEAPADLVELREAGIGRNTHNIVLATLSPDRAFEPRSADRFEITSAACGVCGTTAIDSTTGHLVSLDPTSPEIGASAVERAFDTLEGAPLVTTTGGVHGAAVLELDGEGVVLREDGNQHFAVDKALGGALRQGLDPAASLVGVTGRASFEILEKVLRFGAPGLVFDSTPTSLAVRMAAEHGLTLIGVQDGRAGVYAGRSRVRQTVSR